MRFHVVACSLLVSACGVGDSPIENSTSNGQDGVAAGDPWRAGLYEVTETGEIIGDAPGIAFPPQKHETCYSQRPDDAFLVTIGMNCTREQVRIGGGEVNATMRCTAPGTAIQDVPFELRGTYDRGGAQITGDLVVPQGMIRSTTKLERIGDC